MPKLLLRFFLWRSFVKDEFFIKSLEIDIYIYKVGEVKKFYLFFYFYDEKIFKTDFYSDGKLYFSEYSVC